MHKPTVLKENTMYKADWKKMFKEANLGFRLLEKGMLKKVVNTSSFRNPGLKILVLGLMFSLVSLEAVPLNSSVAIRLFLDRFLN
jgi:hypothetical protein